MTVIEHEHVVELTDADTSERVAHIILRGEMVYTLCGLQARHTEHGKLCLGVEVPNVREVSFCSGCGWPVCPYCRLLAEGLPTA